MKRLIKVSSLLAFLLFLYSCGNTSGEYGKVETDDNPPAQGFNMDGSDAEAIAIADEVMNAMGGRKAWDNTRYICWKFFGRDALIWDKWSGNVRIDRPNGTTLLSNVNDGTGKAFVNETEITDADSVAGYMETARRIWINHSYWLVMPYKLKDSGVTLKYVGEDTTQAGAMSDKLMLTFEGVGVTPNNKYDLWVDKESRLITQWAHYRNAADSEPRFVNPWDDYQKYGEIMLSSSRGRGSMEEIMVFEDLPETVFTSPQKPNLNQAGTE